MLRTTCISLLTLVFALGCSPAAEQAAEVVSEQTASASEGADGGELAAEINGVELRTGELDDWIKEDLFRRAADSPSALYELRESALERIVAERSLESAAAAAGKSIDRLIADKIAELGPVTEAEIAQFYDANKSRLGTAAMADVAPQIKEFLEAQRSSMARDALQQESNVVIHIEAPRVEVAADGPSKGPEDAPITIVEFSDFQCPYCRRVIPTLDAVMERYPGQVRVVYRNFPLSNHRRAKPAAEAALCAGEQDKFWPYHDLLFENARALADEDFKRYATELELDMAAFDSCVADDRNEKQVDVDFREGRDAGVTGTPAFFVNGLLLSGAKPASDFFRIIDQELERKGGA